MPFYKGQDMSGEKNPFYGRRHTPETKEKMRMVRLGKKLSLEVRKNMSLARSGEKRSPRSLETRKKLSMAHRGKRYSIETEFKKGLVPWNKGNGVLCSENIILRQRLDYREWRIAVWKRDDYTCVKCGKRGYKLHAHHILSFVEYPEERYNLDNGITLCPRCHREIHFLQINKVQSLSSSLLLFRSC